MKNQKHFDNRGMSIQIQFNKGKYDIFQADINGNDTSFVGPKPELRQYQEQRQLSETHVPENQTTCKNTIYGKQNNARKLPPFKIPKARVLPFEFTHTDNTSSTLHQHLNTSKSARNKDDFRTSELCKNIFSDVSMPSVSEMTDARTGISVKIDANNKKKVKDKESQNYPKLQLSLTLNEKEAESDFVNVTETGIPHSIPHKSNKVHVNKQLLSILVSEYDTIDDICELNDRSENLKMADSDTHAFNSFKGINIDTIPKLSPVLGIDHAHILPSPQYLSHPPILTPFSEDFSIKTENLKKSMVEIGQGDRNTTKVDALYQKSYDLISPVHVSAIKKTLKRTTHQVLGSTIGEKIKRNFIQTNLKQEITHEMGPSEDAHKLSGVIECKRNDHNFNGLENKREKVHKEDGAEPDKLLTLSRKDKDSRHGNGRYRMSNGLARNKKNLCDGGASGGFKSDSGTSDSGTSHSGTADSGTTDSGTCYSGASGGTKSDCITSDNGTSDCFKRDGGTSDSSRAVCVKSHFSGSDGIKSDCGGSDGIKSDCSERGSIKSDCSAANCNVSVSDTSDTGTNIGTNDYSRNNNSTINSSKSNTGTNDNKNSPSNVGNNISRMNIKDKSSTKTSMKLFSGYNEEGQLQLVTYNTLNLHQPLNDSETSSLPGQAELIIAPQQQNLTLRNFCDDNVSVKSDNSGIKDAVPRAVQENQESILEQVVNGLSVDIEELRGLPPESTIQETSQKKELDNIQCAKTSFICKPASIPQEVEGKMGRVESKYKRSCLSRNSHELETDKIRSLANEDAKNRTLQYHGGLLKEARVNEAVQEPTSFSGVIVNETSNGPTLSSCLKPLHTVSTQLGTAFEQDLLSGMCIKDDSQVCTAAAAGKSTKNPVHDERVSDPNSRGAMNVHSLQQDLVRSLKTKEDMCSKGQSTLEDSLCPSGPSVVRDCLYPNGQKIFGDGFCSKGHSFTSVYQSQHIKTTDGDIQPEIQSLILPSLHHNQITHSATTTPDALPVNVDKKLHYEHNATISWENITSVTVSPPHTTIARVVPSRNATFREPSADGRDFTASSAGDRDFKVSSAGVRDFTALCAGVRDFTSSSAGDRDLTASSAGDRDFTASSVGIRSFTASSVGIRNFTASSAGVRDFTALSAGDRDCIASSAGGRDFTSSSVGVRDCRVSSADGRDFKVSSAGANDLAVSSKHEATLRMPPANVRAPSVDVLPNQIHSPASQLLPLQLNTPRINSIISISKESTKLDPVAVTNMSRHVIRHSGRRHRHNPKETAQATDQLPVYPVQTTGQFNIDNNNNTSYSLISMISSSIDTTSQGRSLTPSSEFTDRVYIHNDDSVSVRQSLSSTEALYERDRFDYRENMLAANLACSGHDLTQLKSTSVSTTGTPDLTPVKSTSVSTTGTPVSHNLGQHTCTRASHRQGEKVRLPGDNSPPFFGYPNAKAGNISIQKIPQTQELWRFGKRHAPIEITSDSESRELGHVVAWKTARTNELRDSVINSAQNSYPRMTENHIQLRQMNEQSLLHPVASEKILDGISIAHVPEAEDCSSVHECKNEPLDLSIPKQYTPPCTEKVPVCLNSQHQVAIMVSSVTGSSKDQPGISARDVITVSSDVTTCVSVNSTACETMSSNQTTWQNKDVFGFKKDSTVAQNSLVNSLSVPIFSVRSQDVYHRSPLLETALLHDIIPIDRDPHPFDGVLPGCLPTQSSSSVKHQTRQLTAKDAGYKEPETHFSQASIPQSLHMHSTVSSTVPRFDNHTLLTSATVILPPVSQISKPLLSTFPNAELATNMASVQNVQYRQHSPQMTTCHLMQTSSITSRQHSGSPRTDTSINSNEVTTSKYPSIDLTLDVENMASKVVPLPVKDFFTHSPMENTYSALLMAKITNKSQQQRGRHRFAALLRHVQPQNPAGKCDSQINNCLHNNLVIDLTDSDDDCKIIPSDPEQRPSNDLKEERFQTTTRHGGIVSVSQTANTNAGLNASSDKEPVGNLLSTNTSADASDTLDISGNGRDTCDPEHESLGNNASIDLTDQPETCIVDVENSEPEFSQVKPPSDPGGSCRDDTYITENGVLASINSQPVLYENYTPSVSVYPNTGYLNTSMMNGTADNALRTANSRIGQPGLYLKMDSPSKELMARKLRSAITKRSNPDEPTRTPVSLPLTSMYNERPHLETQRSPFHYPAERVQTGRSVVTHDNSTQRAAATLLELSANPIYNPYIISPENSGDFQEKVYQIHPVLPDHDSMQWGTSQDGNCNGVQSNNLAETKQYKHRTGRRVGRPPKYEYSSFESFTLAKSKSMSSNHAIPNEVPNNVSQFPQAVDSHASLVHSFVSADSFSNVTVRSSAVTSESLAVSRVPSSLSCIFPINYELANQRQSAKNLQGRISTSMGKQTLRNGRDGKSHEKKIKGNSRHATNMSSQLKESCLANVASKQASDTTLANAAIQSMNINTTTRVSDYQHATHRASTDTLISYSPTTVSDLMSIIRSQDVFSNPSVLVTNQKVPQNYVDCSKTSDSLNSDAATTDSLTFTSHKERISNSKLTKNRNKRAQKRKHQVQSSQEDKSALCDVISAEVASNNDFPLQTCLVNVTDRTNTNEDSINTKHDHTQHEIPVVSKQKRTSKRGVKKRKNKTTRKSSSKVLVNLHQQGINMDNINQHKDIHENMWQAKRSRQLQDINVELDDQTIQYGIQDLQVTEHFDNQEGCLHMTSTANGFTNSDQASANVSRAFDGNASVDKNQLQKEMEVTSILALMMCNRHKGQVQ